VGISRNSRERSPLLFDVILSSDFQTVVRVPLVAREGPSRWCTNWPVSVVLRKKYICSCCFYLSVSVNEFRDCMCFRFQKIITVISRSRFVHVAFMSILVFQTFDRMIFDELSFPEKKGTTWWKYGTHKCYVIRKSLGTHCNLYWAVSRHLREANKTSSPANGWSGESLTALLRLGNHLKTSGHLVGVCAPTTDWLLN